MTIGNAVKLEAIEHEPRLPRWVRADHRGGDVYRQRHVFAVHADLVSFRSTFVFEADGTTLTSDSTLRFRRREEVADSLRSAGFDLDDLRDAPDRPGRELVFIARRPVESPSGNGLPARDSRSRQAANPVYGSGLVGGQ